MCVELTHRLSGCICTRWSMSITLYHAHIVTSATTPPATNCSKFKMFDSLVDVSGCGWQWISGLFQFICQLTVNCELIIIPLLGLVSSDVELSSMLQHSLVLGTITQLSSSWNSSGFYLCSLFRSAINIVVSVGPSYYVLHQQPHRPGYLCHLYDYCPLTQPGSFLLPACYEASSTGLACEK